MIEHEAAQLVINISLIVMVILLPFAFYRVMRGPTAADRLLSLEMITMVMVGITVLLALFEDTDTVIDTGIVLAALSFVGTLAIARYISEGRVF